jgi:hypothetical protein
VSQFAAGCAICGENLVAARSRREKRYDAMPTLNLRAPSWLPQLTRQEVTLGVLLILVALFVPVVGICIAALYAYFTHQSGDVAMRNLALAAIAVGLIVLLVISFAEGGYELLPWVDLQGPFPS